MADKQKIMTPEEVQRAVNGGNYGAQAPTQNPDYPVTGQQTAVTPVQAGTQMQAPQVPQYMQYKDQKMTGKAAEDYKTLLASMPGSYQSPYQSMLDQTVQSMTGRQPFSYDINVDPLYRQLKDMYYKQGRQAMMDTQGQSAALSGGYGNTYGVMSGQQAFMDYLDRLSGQAPQLYQLALEKYRGDEQSDIAKAQALSGLDSAEFGKYQYFDQDAQAKLQDAYTKMKAASGGSGKKKMTLDQYMSIVYGFYGQGDESYAGQTGGKGDAGVDAALAAGVITKEEAASIKQGGAELQKWREHLEIQKEVMGE